MILLISEPGVFRIQVYNGTATLTCLVSFTLC